tara:strand:+ start:135 stop:302 length:168 start_codon:yes stop_codon:yes gene_type:complete
MIEQPGWSRHEQDYYKSKEDHLLREERERAELLEEVRTLKRIMAAIAAQIGASWR